MSTDALLANMDCEREELRAFSAEKEHRQDCGCFEHCDYIIYDEIMSAAKWPLPLYGEGIIILLFIFYPFSFYFIIINYISNIHIAKQMKNRCEMN